VRKKQNTRINSLVVREKQERKMQDENSIGYRVRERWKIKDGFQLSVISFQLREMQDEISISLVFSI
jgi:hypothetical protein